MNNERIQFEKGIMRLSAFDPLSNQYETRILTLPQLPLFEPLDLMFDYTGNHSNRVPRMTKSCSSKKSNHNATSNILIQPRRCQSIPNLCKQTNSKYHHTPRSIKSKKGLSNAFHAVAAFIQKATTTTATAMNKKEQQRQNIIACENWWMSSPPISSY
ncbi:hypothetical protein BD770DRAFT_388559 [Pilaira anomala]|nr:hypothetical protein BD770DRAFT_388559 [Pilaira anomala]